MDNKHVGDMPSSVITGISYIWGTIGILILFNIIFYCGFLSIKVAVGDMLCDIVTCLVLLFCIKKTKSREKWPRWILLILFIMCAPIVIMGLVYNQGSFSLIFGILSLSLAIVQFISLFFLFQPSSTEWIKSVA